MKIDLKLYQFRFNSCQDLIQARFAPQEFKVNPLNNQKSSLFTVIFSA